MSWFTSTEKYVREIESPDGDTAEVTLRRLNAGDMAQLQDTLKMSMDEENTDASMYLGTMRRLTVEKSLIDWTIPGPKPSPEAISQLEPKVFEQIYGHCEIGTPQPQNGASPTNGAAAPNRAERRAAVKKS